MTIPNDIRQRAESWLRTPYNRRKPKSRAQFCRDKHISPSTLRNIELGMGNGNSKVDNVIDLLKGFSDEELALFDRKVYEKAMQDNASAKDRELFAKMQGKLIDKSETRVKLELSAEDLSREFLRARRELESSGDNEVLTRPTLLSRPILLGSGQSSNEDGEVGDVAVSS